MTPKQPIQFKQSPFYYTFTAKEKLPSGMTVEITFTGCHDEWNYNAHFDIGLSVYHKRKQMADNELKTTGRDGLLPLLFAKRAIDAFELYIIDNYGDYHNRIDLIVEWSDNRRRNVYERGLRSLGFAFKYIDGYKCLAKTIQE